MMYNLMSIAVLLATLLHTPKPPTIDVAKVVSHPVEDNVVAAFMVTGIVITPESTGDGGVAVVDSVEVTVVGTSVRDDQNELEYKAWVKGFEQDSSGRYQVDIGLSGRIPLRRGAVKGTVTLRIGARSAAGDQHSEMVYRECTVAVRN